MDNHDKFRCPHCGSDNTASIPLVYKRGHATGTATHTEIVGYDVKTTTTTYADGHSETKETGRTPIYGDVKHDTYTMTDLAAEVAPPQKPQKPAKEDIGGFMSALCILLIFGISFFITGRILNFLPIESTFICLFLGLIIWWLFNSAIARIFDKIYFNLSGINQRYAVALQQYHESLANYRKDYKAWKKSYICMRCGHIFYLDDN